MKKFLERAFELFHNIKVRAIAVAMVVVISFSIAVVVYATEYTDAVEISFDGRVYGYVSDMNEAQKVYDAVSQEVLGNISQERFCSEMTTVKSDKIFDVKTLIEMIESECDSIITVCGIFTDGQLLALAQSEYLAKSVVDSAVATLTTDGAEFLSLNKELEFLSVRTDSDYFSESLFNVEKILNGDYGIEITTVKTETYDEEIAFNTVTKKDSSQKTSYKKVTQKGENGLKSVTAKVTFINGQKQSAEEIESKIVKKAQDHITVVGTKKDTVYYSGYKLASSIMDKSSASYIFPVKCAGSTYISSFWGDSRGHKGIDIAAPKGTDVYAAASGTVTFSGSSGAYGNMIKIKHADGTETVYAHNNKNLVKKGETVKAGQAIAKVGSTGNATGNHLHFELLVNGKRIDPATYVGLK